MTIISKLVLMLSIIFCVVFFVASEIKKLCIWIQFSHVERSLRATANRGVDLNEPCSTLVSTMFMLSLT